MPSAAVALRLHKILLFGRFLYFFFYSAGRENVQVLFCAAAFYLNEIVIYVGGENVSHRK